MINFDDDDRYRHCDTQKVIMIIFMIILIV